MRTVDLIPVSREHKKSLGNYTFQIIRKAKEETTLK